MNVFNHDANLKYDPNQSYTKQEKLYFIAKRDFDSITSDYHSNDNWIWATLFEGMGDDRPLNEFTDEEVEEEWLSIKESLDEEYEYENE